MLTVISYLCISFYIKFVFFPFYLFSATQTFLLDTYAEIKPARFRNNKCLPDS